MGRLLGACDKDVNFFKCVNDELADLVGGDSPAYYYQLDHVASGRDALYDEMKNPIWRTWKDGKPGIPVKYFVRAPEKSGITGEEGYRRENTTQIFIPKKEMDKKRLTKPVPGDIVYVWGKWWDVIIQTRTDAYFADNPEQYVEEAIDLVHRTKGPPQRIWLREQVRT
jgi:hypothetical protein